MPLTLPFRPLAVTLLLGAVLPAAAPAAAQGLADMPTVAYPAAGSSWGCRFAGGCDGRADAAAPTRFLNASAVASTASDAATVALPEGAEPAGTGRP